MRVLAVMVGALLLPLSVWAQQLSLKVDSGATDAGGSGRMSAEDCYRYGIRYSYAECNKYAPRPTPAPAQSDAPHQTRLMTRTKTAKAGVVKTGAAAPPANTFLPRKGEAAKDRFRRIAGQLILVGFEGREPADEGVLRLESALRHGDVSGTIVKDENVSSLGQLQRLTRTLGEAVSEQPVIIAADQPGGPDSVLPEEKGFEPYSSASAIGGEESLPAARAIYRAMAVDLAGLGFNMNIGPSEDACQDWGVDLSASCFAPVPLRAVAYAAAFSAGHHDAGIFAALRHGVDSNGFDARRAKQSAGQAMLQRIMMRNAGDAVIVRARASESAAMLRWLRRARASRGFRPYDVAGRLLIVDLVIDRPRAPMRYGDLLVRAVDAGADMILIRNPADVPGDVSAQFADALLAAVAAKHVQMARLEAAFEKVQRLKVRLAPRESRTEVARLDR